MDLPIYQCHKRVQAVKIHDVVRDLERVFQYAVCRGSDVLGTACGTCERCKFYREHPSGLGGSINFVVDGQYHTIRVNRSYLMKHDPQPGGYYVVYEDGYESFSPAEAFESGYKLVPSPRCGVVDCKDVGPHVHWTSGPMSAVPHS